MSKNAASDEQLLPSSPSSHNYSTIMDNPAFVTSQGTGNGAGGDMIKMVVLTKAERQLIQLADQDDVEGVQELIEVRGGDPAPEGKQLHSARA